MKLDFKKDQKELYQPKVSPSIVDVGEMTFIAVEGTGDPNTSAAYQAAIELLYGLSYTIKMGNKDVLEYAVGPLEGFWSMAGGTTVDFTRPLDKDAFVWTAVIRQPDFVDDAVFEEAKTKLEKKKPHLDVDNARLMRLTEGLCVQSLHIGPFDDEPATIAEMEAFALDQGYTLDLSDERRHHELYMSDFRKVAPEKLKTVIRHPIR